MRLSRGCVSCLIAAIYSLAITCGTLFHNHGWAPPSAHDNCCHHWAHGADREPRSGDHLCRHDPPSAEKQQPADGGSDPCRHAPSHCPVCQFLGQVSLAPNVVDAEAAARVFAEVAPTAPVCPATGFRALWRSRAPPAIA
ncbi:MAG: hypothetical protein ABSF26_19500 [Thermoguttaceae bacterium]|jgi:hypothetical protein